MFGSLVPWRERSLFPTPGSLSPMDRMEIGDLVEKFWGGDGGWLTTKPSFAPTVDLVESENQFEVTVDLPGLKPEEVEVELKDGALWIAGKREEEMEEKGKTYHRVERRHGEFRRVVPLPTPVQAGEIEAKFENGVLKIVAPKSEEAKAKHVEVKA